MAKFCQNCGSQITEESSQFCNHCGVRLIDTTNQKPIGGKSLTVEFVLGLIGGIIGFFAGFAAIFVAVLASAFSVQGASNIIGLGVGAIIFSIIGIVGAAIVKSNTKYAGYLMLISAFGGLICISAFYILSFILLLIAGIMSILYKKS